MKAAGYDTIAYSWFGYCDVEIVHDEMVRLGLGNFWEDKVGGVGPKSER